MKTDIEHIISDKYNGDASKVTREDRDRLAAGEPVAYIIGWVDFLGCRINLSSRPLIPRDETEYWTDVFIRHISNRARSTPLRILDVCAGSGAIGIAILKHIPNAHVSFSEISPKHTKLIEENLSTNSIDSSRYALYTGDVYECLHDSLFDYIVTNPPYIPIGRAVDESVIHFEPNEALFAGDDGLNIIRQIITHAGSHLTESGEVWIECDIENIVRAEALAHEEGFATRIVPDQYERSRVLVAY